MTDILNPIKTKWKRFAVGHVLSNWHPAFTREEVFDYIYAADYPQVTDVMDELQALAWEPFERFSATFIADTLADIALYAQRTEAET
jgi:hypothetical protein